MDVLAVEMPSWQVTLFAFVFGATWGSFFNVAIYRWPREQSVVKPPSACPHCHKRIPAHLNVPILGFLLLRGRTACCGQPLSPRYAVVEILGAVLAVAAARRHIVAAPMDRDLGEAALLAFTFIAGVMLTPILTVAAGFRNGGELVALAGGMTAVIFFAMATIATVSKRDFSFLGKFLFVGLILLIVASLANLFFAVPAMSVTISAIAVLLFSAYLLFDISRIVKGGETNYVTATLGVYLSLYNIFISLLQLLLVFTGQRD